ncbi:hypothetical protein HDU81_008352 [Chytriomyces hyalinus]|nr:hypothetical protein HDU81_008352 [Chytriomyces hyalinus]
MGVWVCVTATFILLRSLPSMDVDVITAVDLETEPTPGTEYGGVRIDYSQANEKHESFHVASEPDCLSVAHKAREQALHSHLEGRGNTLAFNMAKSFSAVASMASNLAADLHSSDGNAPRCFVVPALIGVVKSNIIFVVKRQRLGHVAVDAKSGSVDSKMPDLGLCGVSHVAVVPLHYDKALIALADALAVADSHGILTHTRTKSVETVKAGLGMGLGAVSTTFNAISSTVGGTSTKTTVTTIEVVSEDSTGSPRTSGEEIRTTTTTTTTSSKLLAALNPFKPAPLKIVSEADAPIQLESLSETSNRSATPSPVSEKAPSDVSTLNNDPKTPLSKSANTRPSTFISVLNPFKTAPSSSGSSSLASGKEEVPHLSMSEPSSPVLTPKQTRGTMLSTLPTFNSLLPNQVMQPADVTQDHVQAHDIKALLELDTFFYSEGPWDITRTAEAQKTSTGPDERFFWNLHAMKPFLHLQECKNLIRPMIQGFVEVRSAEGRAGQAGFDVALISRRNKHRAGLRYERRGVDAQGRVANFVETEMIVFAKVEDRTHIGSFLQIRGSIPLYWQQIASTKTLNPTPILEKSDEENLAAMELHISELEKLYKSIVIVDLVGQEGREEPLGTRFKSSVKALKPKGHDSTLHYHAYDFHVQTKGLNYDNVKTLLTNLEAEIESMKHYWSVDGDPMMSQTSILRTNCMDCLDRTNVVQSLFARHMLTKILVKLGLPLLDPDTPTLSPSFESQFKNMWADNGDALSTAYTGTGALKADFTRTGVRNVKGMLNDGLNSVTRLYADNFQNKMKQATVDLFLGV